MAFCACDLRQAGGQVDRLHDPPTTHFMQRIPFGHHLFAQHLAARALYFDDIIPTISKNGKNNR
jgi:hypothetical protein